MPCTDIDEDQNRIDIKRKEKYHIPVMIPMANNKIIETMIAWPRL
jgi:hypothetical protein